MSETHHTKELVSSAFGRMGGAMVERLLAAG